MTPGQDTADALLEDPGDLMDGDAEPTALEADDLRIASIMDALREHGLAFAPEDSVARTAQMIGLQQLLEATPETALARANDLVLTITDDREVLTAAAPSVACALGIDVAATLEAPRERPTHRAVCMVDGCPCAVTYRSTASGGGFVVVTREGIDLETSIGIGPGGRPICPLGDHGEMTLADETIPAAQAIGQVAEKLTTPVQRELPGVRPPFNWAGAGQDMAGQAVRVQALKVVYDDAADKAKKAKKAWDDAEELLTKMGVKYAELARAKGDDTPTTAAPAALRCVWNQRHPGDECPLCAATEIEDRHAIIRLLGAELLPIYANGHADQVVDYRERLDVQQTRDALDGIVYGLKLTDIVAMSPETRAAFRAWVDAGAPIEEFPENAGRPHLTAAIGEDAKVQTCRACGVVLKTFDDAAEALPALNLFGLDCTGTEAEGHRYPDTSKKRARRKADADSPKADKPAKAKKTSGKKKGGRKA